MSSKAAKRRNKAGRPKKEGVNRTPSGQISRAKPERFEDGPQQTVLQARNRMCRPFVEPHDPADWSKPVYELSEVGAVSKGPETKAEKAARKARAKMLRPVSKDDAARLGKRGSVLGCMADDKTITAEMQTVGDDYCQRYITYASLNGMPRPTPQGPAYGAVRGGTRPERVRAAIAAKADHMADQRVLTQCSAGVRWAMKRACVMDEAAPPHLVREGLMALMKARG